MLRKIAEGIWQHQSKFLQSNAVLVRGEQGLLLIDPGITRDEMTALTQNIQELGLPVVAGFSTHPHWDHVLWQAEFGDVPRYGTARGEAEVKAFLSQPDWQTQIIPLLPADLANDIPTDELFGQITGLPAGTAYLPWEGPSVRIIENDGHAAGSAALLIESAGVLVAGDMLSDILTPFLELDANDPAADYLAALQQFTELAADVTTVVPGHGSVGDGNDFRARLAQDRAYVQALANGGGADDARLTEGPQKELLAKVHSWQAQQLAAKKQA